MYIEQIQLTQEQKRLVEENIRLAYFIANKFYNIKFIDDDDLNSIAMFGLTKSSQTFDESKGIKFATYASRCITNEILMFIRKNRKHECVSSLDEVLHTDSEGNTLTYADFISDPKSNFTEDMFSKADFVRVISITLNILKGKRRVVTLYKFANKAQKEIGNLVGISQSYVSRVYKKTFSIIKNHMEVDFEEVFSVDITDFFYRISFLNSNVPYFNQAYANLLKSHPNIIAESKLDVYCENKRTILSIPARLESFAYIADFFQELDKFPANADSIITANMKSTFNQRNCSEINEKIPPMERIKTYFLSLNSFTVQELKETFYKENLFNIRAAIHSAEIAGLITPIGKGKYIVNKTKL